MKLLSFFGLCLAIACAKPTPAPDARADGTGAAGSNSASSTIACAADSDCELSPALQSGAKGCCPECDRYLAGTHAWAAQEKASCSARGPCERASSCLAPPTPTVMAACAGGQCVVVPKK